MEEIIRTLPEDKVYELDVTSPYKYDYPNEDDPYGLYRQYDEHYGYDFDWKPDEDAWEKYDKACREAEKTTITGIEYESIPCDYCNNMDCMNCKFANGF